MFKKKAIILVMFISIFWLNDARVNAAGIRSSLIDDLQGAIAQAVDPPHPPQGRPISDEEYQYWETIQRVAGMVWDDQAQSLATSHGLEILNVTWEDTGRYYGSSVGPNISDVTIQVQHRDPQAERDVLTLMPVIRYPNFSDLTADISAEHFKLLVGNESGQPLKTVSLREYLHHFRRYLHDPDSWDGRRTSLLASRDSHVLVSAQAAFLPIPPGGKAEFNPVIFNYQSYAGDPAVLVIVATREGTSATVIDNVRDAFPAGFSWGQRLFFNQDGERASLTGERKSDFGDPDTDGSTLRTAATVEEGLNMVLIIQVPLKQKRPMMPLGDEEAEGLLMAVPAESSRSDVETAVIGHGEVEGPFTEIDGIRIERDGRFPIRVTVQFYKATSNGIVSPTDLEEIAAQIERVYQDGDYIGSLVVDGPSDRPTEYEGSKEEPDGWWDAFWQRFEDNTELSRKWIVDLWEELNFVARHWGN